MAFCPFQVHTVGHLDSFQNGLADGLHPHMNISPGDAALPAEVGHRAAVDDSIRAVPQASVHRLFGTFLVLHVVQRDLGAAEVLQLRQQILEPVPAQAQADMAGVVGVPALEQGLHNVHAVEHQPGDVLFRVELADLTVGDAPSHDHVVIIQLI